MGERQDDRFKMVFEQEKDDDYQIAFLKNIYGETIKRESIKITVGTTLDTKKKTAKKKFGRELRKYNS